MSDTIGLIVGTYLFVGIILGLRTLPEVIDRAETENDVTLPLYIKAYLWFIAATWWAPIIIRGYWHRHMHR